MAGLLLRAAVDVQVQARGTRAGFNAIRLRCTCVDAGGLDFNVLPMAAPEDMQGERPAWVSQTVHFELIELFSQFPKLCIDASLSSEVADDAGSTIEPRSSKTWEHHCSSPLPVAITTFLQPLPASTDFISAWEAPSLDACKVSVPASPSQKKLGLDTVAQALDCGGALSHFCPHRELARLGAVLSSHGCVDGPLRCLVLLQRSGSGWELEARSEEVRLAEGILVTLASQLQVLGVRPPCAARDIPALKFRRLRTTLAPYPMRFLHETEAGLTPTNAKQRSTKVSKKVWKQQHLVETHPVLLAR